MPMISKNVLKFFIIIMGITGVILFSVGKYRAPMFEQLGYLFLYLVCGLLIADRILNGYQRRKIGAEGFNGK